MSRRSDPAAATSDGPPAPTANDPPETAGPTSRQVQGHLRWGYCVVFAFVILGLALEAMHAFKLGVYLDADQATRRLMWRLAHAHGTLLGVLNLVFAMTSPRLRFGPRALAATTLSLRAATLLMPAGFFLGGVWLHGGDPGVGVLLVPIGGLLLVVAIGLCARAAW